MNPSIVQSALLRCYVGEILEGPLRTIVFPTRITSSFAATCRFFRAEH